MPEDSSDIYTRWNADGSAVNPRTFERWAWPGGYEIFAIMTDGGTLCIPCCNDESNPIHCGDDLEDGWRVSGFGNMSAEDEPVTCDHCGRVIE